MKFLSTRELRNRPGYIRNLTKKDDLVLTAQAAGAPYFCFGVIRAFVCCS